MPVNTYETLFLLDASKVSSDGDAVRQQVHHILEKQGGQILVSREWNYNLKLAYPVEKQKKAAFHIVYYTMDAAKQSDLERDLALAEGVVLRQLTLKIDPKWLETIIGIAREETGKEFAVRGMQDEATVTTDPAAIGGDPALMGMGDLGDRGGDRDAGGPRRGGRRPEPAEKHD